MKENVSKVYFDYELFINRDVEKELAHDLLTGKESEQRVLEFTGIAGQGKTELLKWVYTEAKKKGIFSAYIDFELSEYHRPEIYPILEAIAHHLSLNSHVKNYFAPFNLVLPDYINAFKKYYLDLWKEPKGADRTPVNELEEKLIAGFNAGVKQLLASGKLALCLDSTDKAYFIATQQFEEQVLQHFTDDPNFILVVAGQQRVKWSLRLQKRVNLHQLERFGYEDTRLLVDRLSEKKKFDIEDRDELYKKIWELTLGHPFGSYKFLDIISEGFRNSLKKEIVRTLYPRCIDSLIENVVKGRILANLDLGPVYPPAEKILFYIAPLRRIEFGTLWFMLSTFLEKFKGKSFLFFEELLGEFQNQTYVFSPWRLGEGFEMDEVTRSILLSDLRINHPEHFLEIQEILACQYDIWVSQTRDASQVKNIVEKLYHQTLLLKEIESDDIDAHIQKELEHYLDRYFTTEFLQSEVQMHEQLGRLSKALKGDKELSEMIDVSGLSDIIGNRMKEIQNRKRRNV
ncbi:hypothetical protein QUF72_01805 [Desulfobacterales bacterium HSG2]|nr:hypothetical protein [Desulfobacterales bacterium HSG2]